MIVNRILAAAAQKGKQRQRPNKLGAWNAGQCVRKLWYGEHGYMPEPFDARTMMVFDLGDRVEDAIEHWLTEARIENIRANESRDLVTLPELGCRVRCDFFFQCDIEPIWGSENMVMVPGSEPPPQPGELLVLEVKSMSDFAFDRATRGYIDPAYRAQVECYMRAYGTRHALVLAYRKETSHVVEVLVSRDNAVWGACIESARTARGGVLPPRPYRLEAACSGAATGACVEGRTPKTGKPHKNCGGSGQEPGGPFLVNFPCGFCGVKTECWSDVGELEIAFRDGKPRWRVKERKAA